jgi:hypothetical protein
VHGERNGGRHPGEMKPPKKAKQIFVPKSKAGGLREFDRGKKKRAGRVQYTNNIAVLGFPPPFSLQGKIEENLERVSRNSDGTDLQIGASISRSEERSSGADGLSVVVDAVDPPPAEEFFSWHSYRNTKPRVARKSTKMLLRALKQRIVDRPDLKLQPKLGPILSKYHSQFLKSLESSVVVTRFEASTYLLDLQAQMAGETGDYDEDDLLAVMNDNNEDEVDEFEFISNGLIVESAIDLTHACVPKSDVCPQLQKHFNTAQSVVQSSRDQRSVVHSVATVDVRAARRDENATRLSVTAAGSKVEGSQTTMPIVLHIQVITILSPKTKNLIGSSRASSSDELVSHDLRGLSGGHIRVRGVRTGECIQA